MAVTALGAEGRELLASRGLFAAGRARAPVIRIALWVVLGGAVYGAAMGSLGGAGLGMLSSALKLPLLLGGAALLSLPSFYVLCALLGLRDDFLVALRGIAAAQGTGALALASLAPLTVFVYVSGVAYSDALLWNAAMLAVAAGAGQVTLARHYRELVARRPRHRIARRAWLALYLVVGVKLAWVLRPFVGDPKMPFAWWREAWSDDPYTNLFWAAASLVVRALRAAGLT